MPIRVGPMELIILLVIVMMIFGMGRLPQVGNALGKAFREFRKVKDGVEDLAKPEAAAAPKELEAEKS